MNEALSAFVAGGAFAAYTERTTDNKWRYNRKNEPFGQLTAFNGYDIIRWCRIFDKIRDYKRYQPGKDKEDGQNRRERVSVGIALPI